MALKTEKTLTLYLPALFDNCFLTQAVITDVYKQYTTAYPLLPAATIRRVLLVNSAIKFTYFFPASLVAKMNPQM